MEKEMKKSTRKRSKTQPVSPSDDSTSTLNDSDEVNIEPPADGKTATSPSTKKKKPKKKDETAGSVIVSPRNREPAEGLLSPRRNTESMFSRKRSDTVLSDFEEVLDVADEEGLTDDQVYIAKVMRGIRKGAMYGETLDKLQRDEKELELMKEEDREVMGVQGFIRRDYKDKVLFKFNSPTPGGSRIPLMKKDKVVIMTDYAPRVFHHLRRKCNVPTEDYTKAWTFAKDNLPSPNLGAGRSGSLFVMSSDARFVFKTIPEFEVETLLEILPSIHQHFVDHPESRIIRFLGLHHFYDTITKEETHCIVMNNLLLHPSYAIDEKWDLKGRIPKPGKQGRFADKVDRSKRVLKDNDLLDRRFHLTNEARTDLLRTLNADVEFLKVHNCMDYSLLVGVHFLKEEESAAELAQESAAAATAASSSSSPSKDEKKAVKKAKKGKKKAKNTPAAAAKSDDNDDASGEAVPPPLLDGVMGPIHSDMACAREVYFVGIIDPLSRYKLRKKVAHFLKEMLWDADTLSTVPADYYAERYSRYLAEIFVHREPKLEGAPEPVEVEQDKVEYKPGPASKPDLPLPAAAAAAEEKKELHEEEEKKGKEVEEKKEKEKKGTLKKNKKAKKDEVAAAPAPVAAAADVVAPAPAVVQVVTVRDDSEEAIVVDPVAASVVAATGGAVGREVEIKIEEAPAKADEVAKEKDGDSDRHHNGKEENGGEKKATKGGKKAGKKSAKRTEENGEEVSSSAADEAEGATVKKEKKSKRDGTLKKDKKTKAGVE